MHVLVTYASKRGGTAGLAAMLAEALQTEGFEVDRLEVGDVRTFDGVDAVLLGSGLYANRWLRPARRFADRHQTELRARPVWLFSSGPLDDRAAREKVPPTKQVIRIGAAVGSRGHMTFGGRLAPDATGFPAKAMAKKHSGDWRDRDHVARWAHEVAVALAAAATQQ
jgi:menaquinone-dependent protoporphyrinogen oxidase